MYCYTGLRENNKYESIADFVTRMQTLVVME